MRHHLNSGLHRALFLPELELYQPLVAELGLEQPCQLDALGPLRLAHLRRRPAGRKTVTIVGMNEDSAARHGRLAGVVGGGH